MTRGAFCRSASSLEAQLSTRSSGIVSWSLKLSGSIADRDAMEQRGGGFVGAWFAAVFSYLLTFAVVFLVTFVGLTWHLGAGGRSGGFPTAQFWSSALVATVMALSVLSSLLRRSDGRRRGGTAAPFGTGGGPYGVSAPGEPSTPGPASTTPRTPPPGAAHPVPLTSDRNTARTRAPDHGATDWP